MEVINQVIKGSYCDVLTDTKSRRHLESGWRSNLVVNQCNLLLTMLMRRHAGVEGILFCAIGEGEEEWDTNRPIPLLPDTQLTNEVYRKPISIDQIIYLDENDQPSDTPTNHLDISVEFNGEDIVSNGTQPIREFGLFGGDATDDADSGYLINRVTHDRYDLTPLLTLNRKIHLTFKGGAISQEELTNFGAALPVYNIDGVGKKFTSALKGAGVQSLDDLVKIDPLKPVGKIPLVKLREFRAKARLVMRFKATLAPFVPLADYSISSILLQNPEKLSEIIGSPDINAEMVAHFQEELAILQIALDNTQLKNIRLGDLINV
ncbi:MAG: hypothetical protein PVG39_29000 [Desulfobacteraceae bacterium]|jgi:hypothetical protein